MADFQLIETAANIYSRRFTSPTNPTQLAWDEEIPRFIFTEKVVLGCSLVDSAGDAITTFLGTDVWECFVDVDFMHEDYSGTADAGYSGAVTSIVVNFATDPGTIPDTGGLILENDAFERERIAYTAQSGSGTSRTFTVSATLSYTYLTGDSIGVEDPLMIISDNDEFNISSDWADLDVVNGKISVRIDTNRKAFTDKVAAYRAVNGSVEEVPVYMQINRYATGEDKPTVVVQDVVYARPAVRDVESSGALSTTSWTLPDARYQKLNISVNQASHGLAVNNVIYNNAGTWTKAKADAAGTLGVAVVSGVTDTDNFTFRASGDFTSTSHGYTVGAYLYCSATTAGLLTETAPTGLTEYSNPLVYVLDANTLIVFPWRAEQALVRSLDTAQTAVSTTPYAVLDTDELVLVDATSGANTTNLPTPSADYDGFTVTIKKCDSSANTVTVKCSGGTIDGITGTTGVVLTYENDAITVVCDGANYEIKAVVLGEASALTSAVTQITHTAPGTPDYAFQDMTSTSPYGFVTQDEANTALAVILNLQTRLDELETKLQAHGVIA